MIYCANLQEACAPYLTVHSPYLTAKAFAVAFHVSLFDFSSYM
jgi:hypothetical protein